MAPLNRAPLNRHLDERTKARSVFPIPPLEVVKAPNGHPSALLLVTHNFSQDTASNPYETHPFGVWYDTANARWTIYHEDLADMPEGRAFNVIVYKP